VAIGVVLDPGVLLGLGVAVEFGVAIGVGVKAIDAKQLPYLPTKDDI
jgi:hypothetical protein